MELWERFSRPARQAVLRAHEEAQGAKRQRIGTEHLLLGMLRQGDDAAVQMLSRLGVDVGGLRNEVQGRVLAARPEEPTKYVAFTRDAEKVLGHAYNEAKNLGHRHIGTEHLLVGLARERRGPAYQSLRRRGIGVSKVREAVRTWATERDAPLPGRGARSFGRVVRDLAREAGKEVVVLVVEGGRIACCVSTRPGTERELLEYVKRLLEGEEKRREAEAQGECDEREEGAEKEGR